MISEKTTTLLSAFSRVELNRFRRYIQSPYLNDQPDTLPLFDILCRQLKKGDNSGLIRKVTVWEQLYPGKPFNSAQLRRLTSDLTQLAMRFIAAESEREEPMKEAVRIQKALGKPEYAKHLAGIERQIAKHAEENPQLSPESLLLQFQSRDISFVRNSRGSGSSGYINSLAAADYALDSFYIVQKMRYYVAWLQYKGSRATEEQIALMEGFRRTAAEPRFDNVPLVRLFCMVSDCFSEPDNERHFTSLLEHLDQLTPDIAPENIREFYQMAQNYCALKINQGRTDYYLVYFNLQKKITELRLLLEDGILPETLFKNMITIGLSVGEFEWTEKFINEYYPYLPVSIRENARTFNLANLYFHQKKYGQVIELLRNVEYSDLVYALGSKLILLKTYCESNEQMALDSLTDSFRVYVRRNRDMSKGLKKEYLNFLNFLSRVPNARLTGSLPALHRKVSESQHVISKKWLLEIIGNGMK